jgi:hypothetical protein
MKEWRRQIELKDIISFVPKVDDEDKNICDYSLGFQIYTNVKKLILFCRDEETYNKWIRVLTFLLKKTDIGTQKTNSKPRVPSSILMTDRSRLSEIGLPSKKFGVSDKVPFSSMLGDEDEHCLSSMNDKVDLDKFGFLSKSLYMDASQVEGVVNFSLVENLNKISVKGTNSKSIKTNKSKVPETSSTSTGHFVNPDKKKEFKEDNTSPNIEENAKHITKGAEFDHSNMLTFSKFHPLQENSLKIEENHNSAKILKSTTIMRGNEIDEFIFDVENEAFIGWDKRINFPIGAKKPDNHQNKTSDVPHNLSVKSLIPFATHKEISANTENNLKELLRENSLHLPQGLNGEKIQIENLHRGIDDEIKSIDRKKTIQIGSFLMKDVNMINLNKEEAPKEENNSKRRSYHQIVDQMKEGLKSGNFMVERNISEGDDHKTWYLNLNIKPK